MRKAGLLGSLWTEFLPQSDWNSLSELGLAAGNWQVGHEAMTVAFRG